MFIGHYAAGFALKAVEKRASLGMLFIAAQFVDILFFSFVPFGIEKFNLVENYTAVNHMELYYYPYTHGLLSSFLWAGLIYGLWRYIPGLRAAPRRVALVMALAVLSHWFVDLLAHTPDLPLLGDDSPKLGLGLWRHFTATYVVEVLMLAGGIMLYLRATTAQGVMGRYAMVVFGVFLVALYSYTVTMPFDPELTPTMAGLMGLLLYVLLAGIAFWLDRYRT